jgi:hypothetical protein
MQHQQTTMLSPQNAKGTTGHQPSSVLQKVALLRRCHFPKRDVIKWIGGTMDLTKVDGSRVEVVG